MGDHNQQSVFKLDANKSSDILIQVSYLCVLYLCYAFIFVIDNK